MISSPTKPRLSIRDVASRAKCAVGSASKVLNGSTEVSPAMKRRVLKAATELGYIPNRHARNLKSGRTYRLGLLMPFASDLYYATLLDAFNETVMETEYRLDVQFHRWMDREEDKAIRYFVESGMEGIIMRSCRDSYENAPDIRLLQQYHVPCVTLGMQRSDKTESVFSDVWQDSARGMELLAGHLASMGHQKIALLLPASNSRQAGIQERIDGVEKALAQYPGAGFEAVYLQADSDGVPTSKDFRMHGTSISIFQDYINKLVKKFLNRKKGATAAIAANQMTAWRLINALQAKGIRVPEDFSVVSLGLSSTEHFGGFPLTMSEYSPMEIARNALDILLEKTKSALVQPSLVVRHSSAPVSV